MKKNNKAIIVLALTFLLFSCNVDEKLPDYVNGEYINIEFENEEELIKNIEYLVYYPSSLEIHNPVVKFLDYDKFYLEPLPKKCKDNEYAIEKELVKRKSEHIAFYNRKNDFLIYIYFYDNEEEQVWTLAFMKLQVEAVIVVFGVNNRFYNKSIFVNRNSFYTTDPTLLLNLIKSFLKID